MVDGAIRSVIQNYAQVARRSGIPVTGVCVFGSHARGDARANSDIDLVVFVAPYKQDDERELVSQLWKLRAKTDSRIEPVLATREEWNSDDRRMILDYAAVDAEEITLPPLDEVSPLQATGT